MLGADKHITRRLRLTCLDISALGCRVAGAGEPPGRADAIQVAAAATTAAYVDSRVVHTAPHALGGWLAGFEFLPQDAADRGALIAMRDTVSRW